MAKPILVTTFLVVAVLLQIVHCKDDIGERSFSTSVVGMEFLLGAENQLLLAMENYANKLENKLNIIRGALKEMWVENLKSQINPEEYLSNPINSYALIRRLHQDWVNWEQFLRSSVGEEEINRIAELRANMPTSVDLKEAVDAIFRLNAIYDISPTDMASGLINSIQYSERFTAIDCFSIGYLMFQIDQYYTSEAWLRTSLQLYQDNDINAVLEFDKQKILEMLAKVLLKLGRHIEALDTINLALRLSPHNAKLLQTRSEIEYKIKTSTENVAETIKRDSENEDQTPVNGTSMFRHHCRQYTYQSKLHCLFNKTTSAFLQLAPLKMEILHLDPYIVLFHDVISDAEIDILKKDTEAHLERVQVFHVTTNTAKVAEGRTSKGYFPVNSTNSNIFKRLHQRITDMSGFDLSDSDIVQIMNYGMGGHYLTHPDYFNLTAEHKYKPPSGDRIATVLFYMSDVEQGGATVFPEINISVFPKKGSALMWYNLNNKGDVDPRTAHGACPVIVGSKWENNCMGFLIWKMIVRMILKFQKSIRIEHECQNFNAAEPVTTEVIKTNIRITHKT